MADEVLEMRLVVTAADYEAALAFYRDVLGLREQGAFSTGDRRVTILDAGRATLEIADPPHAEWIDEVEVGRRVAGHIRVAFQVPDTAAATRRLVDGRRDADRRARRDAVAIAELAPRGAGRPPAHAVRAAHGDGGVRLTGFREVRSAATMRSPSLAEVLP